MHADVDFQLIEARTADVPVEMPWRRDRPYMNPHAVFTQRPQPLIQQREHITAVIGRNGTGKSHLLGSIVRTFLDLEKLKRGKEMRQGHLSLSYLAYHMDGRHCVIEQNSKERIQLRVDGVAVSPNDLPLPRRIVALTISPFDKFPVPRSLPHSVAPVDPSLYYYLGLRDQFGKAAIETLLYRSLNSLFDTSEDEALRRANIDAVFDFLALRPTVNIIYRIRSTSKLRNAVQHKCPLTEVGVLSPSQLRRVEEVERGGVSEQDLRMLLALAFERAHGGRIETRASFEAGGILDDFFRMLQPIRRAGFVSLYGVEVTHKSGLTSDLRSASSGQISIVSALVSLAAVISNGSLVLIDEPEISLHPEWQVKYVDLLVRTFARYWGCHFIVATHSPMVISELPSHADVISLDHDMLPQASDLQGQSSDYLLAMAFGLPTNGNLYVKSCIVEAMRLVASGKARSQEFAAKLAGLRKLADGLSDDDPSKTIIDNLQEVANHAGTAGTE